ncbi:MAG: hypothetical protein C4519_28485 [Desulfobacteraceae bacterium]|nr:MAG: hypothetical protein C4519_28485 [Desulfobacteraceae bacterium]
MSELMQILWGFLFLACVYILTQYGINWRIHRANVFVIKDLKLRGAVNAASAVELPYARKRNLNIGMRDFRRRALEELVAKGILGVTTEGKYYLLKSFDEAQSFLSGSKAGG